MTQWLLNAYALALRSLLIEQSLIFILVVSAAFANTTGLLPANWVLKSYCFVLLFQ